LIYKDEEFTQQAEQFLSKIIADSKVPKELKHRFPLFQIIVSIYKILLFNEFEIVIFSSMLDSFHWKYEDLIHNDEGGLLKDFNTNLGIEMDNDCKRMIIFFFLVGFSVKDISEFEKIKAYCEKICLHFYKTFASQDIQIPSSGTEQEIQELCEKNYFRKRGQS